MAGQPSSAWRAPATTNISWRKVSSPLLIVPVKQPRSWDNIFVNALGDDYHVSSSINFNLK